MNKKDIEFYKKLSKTDVLRIASLLQPYTGFFTYPKWYERIKIFLLIRKYKKLRKEISRRIEIYDFIKNHE